MVVSSCIARLGSDEHRGLSPCMKQYSDGVKCISALRSVIDDGEGAREVG